jgi:glucosamine--fructose-6-phosphate aminotransferase (isomerizing)
VASTKAFAAQVVVLTLLALALGRRRDLPLSRGLRLVQGLRRLPEQIGRALECRPEVERIANKYAHARAALYLGRGPLYPVALEGALKLQEVAYVHARGLPAAEMKHGPLALVDRETPVIVLALRGPHFERVMGNLEEVRARGAPIIAVATEGDEEVVGRADEVLYVPDVPPELQPVVAAVPLQLLAYAVGVLRGCDVDRPRHLAKSVTVE